MAGNFQAGNGAASNGAASGSSTGSAESAEYSVLLPGVLQPLVGGQSYLTASADGAVTVGRLLDLVTGDYPVLARRLRDETGALRRYVNIYVSGDEVRRLDGLKTKVLPGQEILIVQSVAGG